MDICTLPMPGSPTFSCDMEMYIWLLRNQEYGLIPFWWMGWEFASQGRSFERVVWEIENTQRIDELK